MAKKILITGSNRGIGLALVQHLRERGEDVIAACRSSSPALEELDVRVETDVELTSDSSLAALEERLRPEHLDWLILNAGIMRRESLDALDMDTIREQFEVNSLGPLRAVSQLRSRLKAGSKIGIITSRMGSIADNGSGGYYGYRMSKAAVNAAGKSLAIDLQPNQISVAILHPGFVQTDMTSKNGNLTPRQSAEGLIARLDELTLETTGSFLHVQGEVLPW